MAPLKETFDHQPKSLTDQACEIAIDLEERVKNQNDSFNLPQE